MPANRPIPEQKFVKKYPIKKFEDYICYYEQGSGPYPPIGSMEQPKMKCDKSAYSRIVHVYKAWKEMFKEDRIAWDAEFGAITMSQLYEHLSANRKIFVEKYADL